MVPGGDGHLVPLHHAPAEEPHPGVSRGLASLAGVTCLALRGFTHIRGPDILLLGQSLQGLEYLEVDTMTDLTGEVALVLDRLEVELPRVTVARFTLLKI